MYECKDCQHLAVCKFTDAGDGRCQKPQHFINKHQLQAVVGISPNTKRALEQIGRTAHGG